MLKNVPSRARITPLFVKKKMTKKFARTAIEPATGFLDPRLGSNFKPGLWPLCNGLAAPKTGSKGLFERRCLEFLAAFYRVNVANHRLIEARKARASKKIIKTRLDAVASATTDLESLEDRYAPIGFFGEPVMDGIRYQNIIFAHPEVPKQYRQPEMQVMSFAIPGLDAIPNSELRGRPKLRRFGHARLDL
jgi:hypothetical protein